MKQLNCHRYFLVMVALIASFSISHSQNLIPNPSFEQYTQCPDGFDQLALAIPWVWGNNGTADFFHTCGSGNADVPANGLGVQDPVHGLGYAGVITLYPTEGDYREYAQVELDSSLKAGYCYILSFYVSPGDFYCRTRPFGAFFSPEPPGFNNWFVIEEDPQIEVNGEFLGGYDEWTFISRGFVAEGGERYITIGNFRNDEETVFDPVCADSDLAYYYIDSVMLIESDEVSFGAFASPPVTGCPPLEIAPGQTADNYVWEDGSTNPTLIVNASGTYEVTLSNGCHFLTTSIEVTVLNNAPPVTLPNDTILCPGEEVEISLDPDSGDYEWDDGSIDSDYTITSSGTYSVTLTDECDETSDVIVVTYIDPPEPFSLGEDTLVCDGEPFDLSLDPLLGDFEWHDGSSSSTYTVDMNGTYALTISNQCGETEDEMYAEFMGPLVFDIGPEEAPLCDGESIDISLNPDLGYFLWSDGSTDNAFEITDAGTYSVTVTNACFTESDEMEVSIFYAPEFDLGPDLMLCDGEFPFIIDLSDVPHAETWLWNDGSDLPIGTIAEPGTYSVTISNACFDVVDAITITSANEAPDVNLPPDQLLCQSQTITLDAGDIMGDYEWQDGSTTDTFLVTAPGQYMLTVTTSCGTGADTVIVEYIPALAPPDVGADISLCPGETAILYAGVDNVNYQWNDLSTADSLIVTEPGTYSLQISDQCTSASDTVVVTFNANPPNVDLPATIDLCEGNTAIIESGISGVSYLWNDNSTGPSLFVNAPGTYTLTVSNACGSDIDSIIVNDAGPPPFVALGNDFSLCEGDSFISFPPFANVDTWLWHDGSNDDHYEITNGGPVVVEVWNSCGYLRDSIYVTLLPSTSPLDLGSDLSICPGETATLTISEPNVTIEWHDGSSDPDFIVSDAGMVYATISNACGSASDTVAVSLLDAIPLLDLGADQSLCPGETITIDPGITDVAYSWLEVSNGEVSTGSTTAVTVPGMIILTISNECGTSTDTVVIIEDTNGPQVDLGPDILACEGDSVILNAGISGVEYLWQDGSTGSLFNVQSSGTFILHVSNQCGMDSDTILVDIYGTVPNPSLGGDTTLCAGEVLTLISAADAETSIQWHDGSMASSFLVSEEGIYSLTETNHCGSASDTIVVSYQSAPDVVDLGEDVMICPGDTVLLPAPPTNDVVTWSLTAGGVTIDSIGAAVYAPNTITLTVANDCGVASDEVIISFDQEVPIVDLGPPDALCPDQSVTLDVTQSFAAAYLWSTGSTTPSIVATDPDTYAVTVTTKCYSEADDVLIEGSDACDEFEIFIPNVFSPNGDNVNDDWIILINDPNVIGIECSVYDRWGDLVFETKADPIMWNGKFNEKEVMPAVYAYVMILSKQDGESELFTGDITLIR